VEPREEGVLVRKLLFAVLLVVLPLSFAAPAAANDQAAVTIETQKPFGSSPGAFSATGAFTGSGAFVNTRFTFSAVAAPGFVIVHLTQTFTGAAGTFTLKVEITETATADPNVLTDDGSWAVITGTGAYRTLHGQGHLTGTANDNTGVITRTYVGTVQMN
jgi:hypothetical protein